MGRRKNEGDRWPRFRFPKKLRGFSTAPFGLRAQPLRFAARRAGGGPSGWETQREPLIAALFHSLDLIPINGLNQWPAIDSKHSLDAAENAAEISRMQNDHDPRYLRRIDPTRNMARFYVLSLQPTLFGETSLVRNWGRIGTRGLEKIELFATANEAETAFSKLTARKYRRGYREKETHVGR